QRIMPLLIDALNANTNNENYVSLLKNWDFRMDKDRPEPLIYQLFLDKLLDQLATLITGKRDLLKPDKWLMLSYFEDHPLIEIKEFKQDRDVFIRDTFDLTIAELKSRYGDDFKKWRYGDFHRTKINHVLRLEPFSVNEFASDGSQYTVRVARGPLVTHGSSQRHIFHMGNPVDVYVNIYGGQSGRPSSKNYQNQLADWKEVRHRKAQYVNTAEELKGIEFVVRIGENQ
ncbi:MAG: penicillin acylase family protein, partial [Calditrichaeota bacterium]|nr:penicillin acylase family protein [Calditrichota bacterium]